MAESTKQTTAVLGLQKADTVYPGQTRSQDAGVTSLPQLPLLPDQPPVDMEQPVF